MGLGSVLPPCASLGQTQFSGLSLGTRVHSLDLFVSFLNPQGYFLELDTIRM